MQDPITKCNDGNDTQIIITEDIAAYVLLELQIQQVRPESQDNLKTNFVLLESMEYPPKESKKENKAMSAQSIISCTEKCNDVINLLNNFMGGSKSKPTANKDIHLALKTFNKVTTYVERAASNHLTSYAKILRKRERVQEEDDFYLKNTQYGNSVLKKARFNCNFFLESEDLIIRKTTSNKNRKNLHRNTSSIMKI